MSTKRWRRSAGVGRALGGRDPRARHPPRVAPRGSFQRARPPRISGNRRSALAGQHVLALTKPVTAKLAVGQLVPRRHRRRRHARRTSPTSERTRIHARDGRASLVHPGLRLPRLPRCRSPAHFPRGPLQRARHRRRFPRRHLGRRSPASAIAVVRERRAADPSARKSWLSRSSKMSSSSSSSPST